MWVLPIVLANNHPGSFAPPRSGLLVAVMPLAQPINSGVGRSPPEPPWPLPRISQSCSGVPAQVRSKLLDEARALQFRQPMAAYSTMPLHRPRFALAREEFHLNM